jgi:hypothetical protein
LAVLSRFATFHADVNGLSDIFQAIDEVPVKVLDTLATQTMQRLPGCTWISIQERRDYAKHLA